MDEFNTNPFGTKQDQSSTMNGFYKVTELENKVSQLTDLVSALQNDNRVSTLTDQVHSLQTDTAKLNRYLPSTDKDIITSTVDDAIYDTLWDKIFYLSSFATSSTTTTAVSPGTLSANARESDTTLGLRFNPKKACKFKASFYFAKVSGSQNVSKAVVYLGAPGISTVTTTPTNILDSTISFVGVKFNAGVLTLINSLSGTPTATNPSTTITVTDDTTHTIEIDYYLSHAVFLYDNVIVGDIPCNISTINPIGTFFPFITSVISTDGTNVNFTIEGFEFLQRRL